MSESNTPNSNTNKESNSYNGYNLSSITETVINGLFTVDDKWIVKAWNQGAEKFSGISSRDMVGKNIWEQLSDKIASGFIEKYKGLAIKNIPCYLDEYNKETDERFEINTFYFDNVLTVSFKKVTLNVSASPADIKLDTLSELYRFVTEVTNDCLWEWNIETKEIFWIDGGHKRVFGYPIENALIPQLFWERCVHPADKDRVLSLRNRIVSEARINVWEDQYRFKKSNGDYAYVEDRGRIIYNDKNVATRMIGATQDVTARKLAELQLLETERELSFIARETINAVVITDAEGKITWVNRAFTTLTEHQAHEVIGKKPGSFLQGEQTDKATVQYLRKMMLDKTPFDCELLNYSKSGRMYWTHLQGQPLLDKEGNCERFFAIETDITEKVSLQSKLSEELLIRQREIAGAVITAQEKERATIGQELHDNLNQILAVAKLYMQMAKSNVKNRETYIDESIYNIIHVIEEIRRISRSFVIPGLLGVGLFSHVKKIISDLKLVHPLNVQFNYHGINENNMTGNLKLNILRIIQEQLTNILKHSRATEANVELIKHEHQIELLITDNGVGNQQTQYKQGIGMINIRSRADMHDGSVAIVTNPGEGFKLKVLLDAE